MNAITQEQDSLRIKKDEFETNSQRLVAGSKARLFCIVLFFIAIAFTYLQWYPHNYRAFKIEDSGLFLHIGQRMLHGDVLYRDIADNKPPLIYWLNEFGLLLGHGSAGGVLLLCMAAGILTFATLYWGLQKYFGWQLVITTSCLAQLAFLRCAIHPNYTESFALPLIAMAAVLFVRESLGPQRVPLLSLAQGSLAALLFCLRPNNVGISIIYVFYLLIEARKGGRFRQLGLFTLGGAATYGLVLAALAVQGTLPDYVLYVFRMAGPYTAGTTTVAKVRAFWHGIALFDTSPLFYFSLACGATAILVKRANRRTLLLLWVGAWFGLEMLLSSTSGYHWDHYYLLWIIPMALILMLSVSIVFERAVMSVLPVIFAASLSIVLLNEAVLNGYRAQSYPRGEDPAVELVRTYAHKGDRVTTWGYYYHDLWFDLDHKPGTRWFHEGAYTNRMIYRALMPMFLSDLEKNLPRVIVERRSMVPLFAPADPTEPLNEAFPAEYFIGWDDAAILQRKAALAKHYHPVTDDSEFVVYLRDK